MDAAHCPVFHLKVSRPCRRTWAQRSWSPTTKASSTSPATWCVSKSLLPPSRSLVPSPCSSESRLLLLRRLSVTLFSLSVVHLCTSGIFYCGMMFVMVVTCYCNFRHTIITITAKRKQVAKKRKMSCATAAATCLPWTRLSDEEDSSGRQQQQQQQQ